MDKHESENRNKKRFRTVGCLEVDPASIMKHPNVVANMTCLFQFLAKRYDAIRPCERKIKVLISGNEEVKLG